MIPRETINKAIDYILLHLTTQISVEDVAAFCGWSKFYFCREFKRYTGQSVHSFIKRMRLEQITIKLKTGDRTISDICLDYGISPSNFVPAFKKQQKISPFYFRKNLQSVLLNTIFFILRQIPAEKMERHGLQVLRKFLQR